jgi:GTP:adenosylcobinamide-phosphate guanylyltransferase
MLNAIILAGTHADKTKLIYGKNKAFLEINEQPIINNVINSLKKAKSIDRIAIVGPAELENIVEQEITIESRARKEARRFIENVMTPYNLLSKFSKKALFIPCDLPFISPETIDDFVSNCKDNADFYFSLINIENIPPEIEPFKKSSGFYLKERKGYFRTANLVLFDGSNVDNKKMEYIESFVEKAFPIRRITSALAYLRLAEFIAKNYFPEAIKYFIQKNLTENDIINAFKRKPGVLFRLIETKDPRAVMDIDTEEEYEFIKASYKRLSEKK